MVIEVTWVLLTLQSRTHFSMHYHARYFYYSIFLFFDSYYGMTLMKKPILKTFVFILAIIVVFNGALNPGIILTITILLIANAFFKTDTNLSLSKRVIQVFTNVPKTMLFAQYL